MVYTSWKIASQLSQRSFAPSLWCLHIGFIQPVSMFLLLPNQHQLPCVLELPRVADITTLQVNHTLKQVVPAQPLLRSQPLSPVVVFAAPTHHLLPSVLVDRWLPVLPTRIHDLEAGRIAPIPPPLSINKADGGDVVEAHATIDGHATL